MAKTLGRVFRKAASSSTYRVLKAAGLLQRWNPKASRKGNGFQQPLGPHEHWHVDISYLNIAGTFFYLCSVLDGCSRFLLHCELRTAMTELDVEIVLQRTRERYPNTSPRIITDNGPRGFKEFIPRSARLLVTRICKTGESRYCKCEKRCRLRLDFTTQKFEKISA